MKKNYDVVIAGAGPSGLYAALRLAEKGHEVLVLEKKSEVGEAVNCTGIVGRETFERFSLPETSKLRDIQDVRMVSPAGISLVYRHPSPFAFVVDRGKFDRDIAREAASQGAVIRTGCEVKHVIPGGEGVSVIAEEEEGGALTFSARVAVMATGIHWNLNKKLGLGIPRGRLFGAQVELDAPESELPTIFSGTGIAEGGFAWAVPSSPGRVKFGLVTESDPRACFRKFAETYLDGRLGEASAGEVQYKAIAQGMASKTYARSVISLGEAAGQVKTTTGGGISYGLHCAEIAASVIASRLRLGLRREHDLQQYERSWRRALQREIQVGLFARKIWARLSDSHIENIFRVAQEDGLIPLIQKKGEFDWHSDLILALLRQASLTKILTGVGKAFLPFKDSLS